MYIASDQGKGIEKLGTGRKEGCEEDGSVPWCFCLSQAIVGEDGFAGDEGGVSRRTRSLFENYRILCVGRRSSALIREKYLISDIR